MSTRLEAVNVPSPCVGVCHMLEASGLCAGCQRTLEEIAHWGRYDASERREVLERIRQRRVPGSVAAPKETP